MLISVACRVILAIHSFQEIFVDLLAARVVEKVCFYIQPFEFQHLVLVILCLYHNLCSVFGLKRGIFDFHRMAIQCFRCFQKHFCRLQL